MKKIEQLTFEEACNIEGLDAEKIILTATQLAELFPQRDRKSTISHSKLVIMVKAANRLANDGKEWVPDFSNGKPKYVPLFVWDVASSGFRVYDDDYWRSLSAVGSRLCFISYDVMKAMVENHHYMKVYNEYAA